MLTATYAKLSDLASRQLAVAPEQENFFTKRFDGLSIETLAAMEDLAGHVSKLIADNAEQFLADYVWVCEELLKEELYFRRHKKYRLSTFDEAYAEVYSNKNYMSRYMNGLLMTQLWWANHFDIIAYYRSTFLTSNKAGYNHLEIGPGHGLFLYFAAADPNSNDVTGWDVSEASIASTKSALQTLGLETLPALELQNLFENPQGSFDSVVFSEVLEHLDEPQRALEVIRSLLAPEGRLFLNMPINSPAPDHLFNLDSPEAVESFIKDAGFAIKNRAFFPATNQTIELARKKKLTISCGFIATKA